MKRQVVPHSSRYRIEKRGYGRIAATVSVALCIFHDKLARSYSHFITLARTTPPTRCVGVLCNLLPAGS